MRKSAKYFLNQRRTLAWAAAGWVLVQAVLAAVIELALPEARDPEYAVREQRLLARLAGGERPLWLALGSSRTQLGLQAAKLDAHDDRQAPLVFNFGMPGCGPLLQRVCFERLLARGVRPAKLFVEVNPALFAWRGGEPMEERMLDGARLSPAELARVLPYYSEPRRVLGKWAWAWFLPCHRRSAELRRLMAGGQAASDADAADHLMDKYGWQHVPAPVDAARRRELTKMAADQYDGALSRFEPGSAQRKLLDELLARCRQESIQAVLVLMPEGTSFERLYGPQSEPALKQLLAELSRKHDVAVIDARRWVADEFFSDGHHLLPDGATAFTDRFAREALPVRVVSDAMQRR